MDREERNKAVTKMVDHLYNMTPDEREKEVNRTLLGIKLTVDDHDSIFERHEALFKRLACLNGEPCPSAYTRREQWINRGGLAGVVVAIATAALAYFFGPPK